MDGRDECRKRINTKKYYIIFCDVLKLDLTNHKERGGGALLQDGLCGARAFAAGKASKGANRLSVEPSTTHYPPK